MRKPGSSAWWIVVAALAAAGADPAMATFPGGNDKIAYTSIVDAGTSAARTAIFVDTVPLTNPLPGENHSWPSWSADGKKLVFVSQTSSPFEYRIEKINWDGTGRQVLLNVTQAGLPAPSSPIWDRYGIKVTFRAGTGALTLYVLYPTGGVAQLPNPWAASEIDGSSRGQIVRKTQVGVTDTNVLTWNCDGPCPDGGSQLSINIPGQLGLPLVDAPVWMPDGEAIVFRAAYSSMESGLPIARREWFRIRRDGTGVEQLTKAEDSCPLPGLQSDFSFVAAAPSPDGDLITLMGSKAALKSYDGTTCTYRQTTGLWGIRAVRNPLAPVGSATGGPPNVVHEDKNAQGRPSWRPNPASLVVKIDDGRGNPLQGLKVEIYDATAPANSPPLNVVAQNGNGGSYSFQVPIGSYRVRATLLDNRLGGGPSFDVRRAAVTGAGGGPDEAIWLERIFFNLPGIPVPKFSFSSAPGSSNLPESERDTLDEMAHIYYRTKQYVDWVRANLTPLTGDHVRIYTFATTSLAGSQVLPRDMRYSAVYKAIVMGTAASEYADRDGGARAESPENGEWHEFTHHLTETFINRGNVCPGANHGGYDNIDTCDSVDEGLSAFLPTLAAQAIDGASDANYDNKMNIEQNLMAWAYSSDGKSLEDRAVAALLWDLVDDSIDAEPSEAVGTAGSHHPVTYQDTVSLPLAELWGHLTDLGTTTATVRDLREKLGTQVPTHDLDGIGGADVAPIDEVFLMHGFFPVKGDQQKTPTHTTYHFNVSGGSQNDHVGRTDHDLLDVNNNVTTEGLPRLRMPGDENANIAVSTRDASGTPLAGATVRLTISGGVQHTIERPLGGGDASLVHLELPSYFSYLLPTDAPGLPPCDPVNDTDVDVVVTARINGYDSADSFTFDNCAYWHAIEASTGSSALAFTMTFPEDATPPVSAVQAVPSLPPTNGATMGYWTLQFSCSDPVTGGFASGCHRSEYRINGGPIEPYTRALELMASGTYVVEFRSLDGAANAETFQSATYTVIPQQDSDGDGLNDAYEISIGTGPNHADSDNDGLRDDQELTHRTDPRSGDTDFDGLGDGGRGRTRNRTRWWWTRTATACSTEPR
jgi:hypothetical protein